MTELLTLDQAKIIIENQDKLIAALRRSPDEQERERTRALTQRVHALEAERKDTDNSLRRMYTRLGKEAMDQKLPKALVMRGSPAPWELEELEPAEGPDPRMPLSDALSDAEIRELMTTCLHGPLPSRTMSRVLFTVAQVPGLRAELARRKRGDRTRKRTSSNGKR